MVKTLFFIGAGSFAGGIARYLLSRLIQSHAASGFPWGTLAVNLVGCLIIGLLYGWFLLRPEVPIEIRAGLIVGFVGGLTTFSSFSLDTVRLLESGQALVAFGYLGISVFGGLLATWAGLSLTKL